MFEGLELISLELITYLSLKWYLFQNKKVKREKEKEKELIELKYAKEILLELISNVLEPWEQ